jgi:pimeloyl-ACP methyl ester carboxylesterase
MSMSLLLALGLPLGGYIGLCLYLPYQKDILEAVTGTTDGELDKDDVFAQDEEEEAEKSSEIRALEFERDLLCMDPVADLIGCTALSTTPIFLGHGELDEKKPPALGQAAAETLRAIGFDVTWKLYPELGHWHKVPGEIEDIADFVKCRVGWRLAGDEALRGVAPP